MVRGGRGAICKPSALRVWKGGRAICKPSALRVPALPMTTFLGDGTTTQLPFHSPPLPPPCLPCCPTTNPRPPRLASRTHREAQRASDAVNYVLRAQDHRALHGLYNRLLHLNRDEYPEGRHALNARLPFGEIEEAYMRDGMLAIDRFLEEEAVELLCVGRGGVCVGGGLHHCGPRPTTAATDHDQHHEARRHHQPQSSFSLPANPPHPT